MHGRQPALVRCRLGRQGGNGMIRLHPLPPHLCRLSEAFARRLRLRLRSSFSGANLLALLRERADDSGKRRHALPRGCGSHARALCVCVCVCDS